MPVRGKGYLAFQPFFPREIDSFALELCFIVDFVCQIVFRKMGNKFPFDVTAKRMMENPPPPPLPLYHQCRSPWRVLTAFWIILFPRACVTLIHRNGDLTILGDPGADSGGEGSLNARKNKARRKGKNGEKSPWGQCLTRPVPNGRRRSGFWLVPENSANLVPRVFGLFGQRDNAAQNARIRSEDDPKTTRRLYWAKHRSGGYGIRDCEQWGTAYILMDLASLFMWSFGKKSC